MIKLYKSTQRASEASFSCNRRDGATPPPTNFFSRLASLFFIALFAVGTVSAETKDYKKITSINELTKGNYLIVCEESNVAFDGNLTTLDATSNTQAITITNNNQISLDGKYSFAIEPITGGYKIESASGYSIGNTTDGNALKSSTTTSYVNTISFDETSGEAVIVSASSHLRYNSASGQTRFRYFKSSTYSAQKKIFLYKEVADDEPDYTTSIIFDKESYTIYTNSAGYISNVISAQVNSGAQITFTSSDENILCIEDGEYVTFDATGQVTVTASVPANGNFPAKTETVTVNVIEQPVINYVMLVGQAQNGVYYAMKSAAGSADKTMAAVPVVVRDGKVLVESVDNSLLWNIDSEAKTIAAYNEQYLSSKSKKTELSLSPNSYEWTWIEDGSYWANGDRPILGIVDEDDNVYFKAYSTVNIGKTVSGTGAYFNTVAVAMPYEVYTPGEGELVEVSAAGYATMYYGSYDLVVPEGVEAYTYSVEGTTLNVSKTYTEGQVIPAGEAVVIKAAADIYLFEEVLSPTAVKDANNVLRGSDVAEETTGGDKYYKLSTKNGADVGFYYGNAGGAAFENGAHKAYLALDGSNPAPAFVFGDATGIATATAKTEKTVYDLQGRKVTNPKRGLYIVNGKVVSIK